jgi:hypothetical protein
MSGSDLEYLDQNTHSDDGVDVLDKADLEKVDESSRDIRWRVCASLEGGGSSGNCERGDSGEESSEVNHADQ